MINNSDDWENYSLASVDYPGPLISPQLLKKASDELPETITENWDCEKSQSDEFQYHKLNLDLRWNYLFILLFALPTMMIGLFWLRYIIKNKYRSWSKPANLTIIYSGNNSFPLWGILTTLVLLIFGVGLGFEWLIVKTDLLNAYLSRNLEIWEVSGFRNSSQFWYFHQYMELLMLMFIGLIPFIIVLFTRHQWSNYLGFSFHKIWYQVRLGFQYMYPGLLILIILTTITVFLIVITMPAGWNHLDQSLNNTFIMVQYNFYGNLILNLFIIVILAPVAEEYFFRGFLLRYFLDNDKPNWGIFLSIIGFGVYHILWLTTSEPGLSGIISDNLSKVWVTSFYGIFLTFCYIRIRSVISTIVIHSVFNGVLFFTAVAAGYIV